MRTIPGISMAVIAFIGVTYFKGYSGHTIPYPILWLIGFILLGIAGVWLVASSSMRAGKKITKQWQEKLDQLKAKAEKIQLDFDLCEFKDGSYTHEVKDESLAGLEALGLIAGAPTLMINATRNEQVYRSTLIYTLEEAGENKRFIQSFPCDPVALKLHVMNNEITLYVDRVNRDIYYFELKQ